MIGAGIMPQLYQTIGRAEVWAVIMCLDWAMTFHCIPWIYSDSAYAVDGCNHILRHGDVPSHWADQDLWKFLKWYIECAPADFRIFKVRAHLDEGASGDEHQAWCTYWNSVADVNAKAACKHAGTARLRQIYSELLSTFRAHSTLAVSFQHFLLDMALFDLENKNVTTPPDENFDLILAFEFTSNTGGLSDAFPVSWRQQLCADSWISSFGSDLACDLVDWLLRLETRADFCAQVTLLELLMAFRLESQAVLPLLIERDGTCCWQTVQSLRAGELAPRTMASQLKAFRSLLMAIDRTLGCSLEWGRTSRTESRVELSLESFNCPWPADLAERVHFELQSFVARRPIRRMADLARPWL